MSKHFPLVCGFALALLAGFGGAGLLFGAVPRPEHPRPDAYRADWITLNGEWQFEIDQRGDGEARGLRSGKDLASRITVPFCPESKLSGVGHYRADEECLVSPDV